MAEAQFYAYVHFKPDFTPFYVGKGKGARAFEFNRRKQNPHYANIVEKYGKPLVSKIECSSEEIAFDLEKGLIKCFRRMGEKLVNLNSGGEGSSGYKFTAEDTARQSKGLIEANKRPGVKEKRAASLSKTWAIPSVKVKWKKALRDALSTPEARLLKRDAFERGFTENTRQKLRACAIKGNADPIVKFKVGAATRGTIWITHCETREKQRVIPEEANLYFSFGWVRGKEKI